MDTRFMHVEGLTNIGLLAAIWSPHVTSKLEHRQSYVQQQCYVIRWRYSRLVVDAEQMAKQILCEASVEPGVQPQTPFVHDLHLQPGVQILESDRDIMSIETGDLVGACPSSEEFLPELFEQIIDQEFSVEAACKVEQVDIEAVFGVLCQSSIGDPRDKTFECGGSIVCPEKEALSLPGWEVATVVPEKTADPGCQSTVQGKLPAVWANVEREVYAINSITSFCQTLVFLMFRT